MKALFTATCQYCQLLKPRCASVTYWNGASSLAGSPPLSQANLCEDCRKKLKGYFVVHQLNKGE